MSLLPVVNMGGRSQWILALLCSGESGWAQEAWLGPLPWAEQAGLAGLIPGSGKAFLPGWPGIQTQTKGAFLSRLFVLLPQSCSLHGKS